MDDADDRLLRRLGQLTPFLIPAGIALVLAVTATYYRLARTTIETQHIGSMKGACNVFFGDLHIIRAVLAHQKS